MMTKTKINNADANPIVLNTGRLNNFMIPPPIFYFPLEHFQLQCQKLEMF